MLLSKKYVSKSKMTRTKMLIDQAKDQNLKIKDIVMQLLTAPMNEEQKELILKLYRLIK